MRRRLNLDLNDDLPLILALLVVLLLVISLLYCLGFASLALRPALESTPSPSAVASLTPSDLNVSPLQVPAEATAEPMPLP